MHRYSRYIKVFRLNIFTCKLVPSFVCGSGLNSAQTFVNLALMYLVPALTAVSNSVCMMYDTGKVLLPDSRCLPQSQHNEVHPGECWRKAAGQTTLL